MCRPYSHLFHSRIITQFNYRYFFQKGDSDSDMNYSDDEDEQISYNDYYNMHYYTGDDCDIEQVDLHKADPEYFSYDCLSVEEVERLFNESVETLSNSLQVSTIDTYKYTISSS